MESPLLHICRAQPALSGVSSLAREAGSHNEIVQSCLPVVESGSLPASQPLSTQSSPDNNKGKKCLPCTIKYSKPQCKPLQKSLPDKEQNLQDTSTWAKEKKKKKKGAGERPWLPISSPHSRSTHSGGEEGETLPPSQVDKLGLPLSH